MGNVSMVHRVNQPEPRKMWKECEEIEKKSQNEQQDLKKLKIHEKIALMREKKREQDENKQQ